MPYNSFVDRTVCPCTMPSMDRHSEARFVVSRLREDLPALASLRELAGRDRWEEAASALQVYLRCRTSPCLFFDPAAVPSLLEKIAAVDPEHFRATCAVADHALLWEFPNSTNARIERFVPLGADYDFVANPTHDPQFVFAMNRLRWMPELAKLHRATDRRDVLDFLLVFWRLYVERVGYPQRADFDRMADHWHGHLAPPWSRLDHFIRLTNLWWTFWLLLDAPCVAPSDTIWMLAQILRQHDVVLAHGPSDLRLNHSAMQYESLFLTAVMLPEFHGMEASAMAARIALEESLILAFFEDGLHYEQSPDYGQGCLLWYGQSLLLAERNGHRWMRAFRDRLRRAFEAYDRIATPAGTCPILGDSDPSPVVPFLVLGRALFPDLGFTRRIQPCAAQVWYGGDTRQEPPSIPSRRVEIFPSAGLAVVRHDGNYLSFDCGTKGFWHGHADLLHVHFWLRGESILGDGGRWLYADDAFREWVLSPAAHNTVVAADRTMAAIEDPAHPGLGPLRAREAGGFVWLSAWHDAFSRPDEPARCRRFIVLDPQAGWLLIVDHLSASVSLTWRQYWLLPREDVVLARRTVTVGAVARMLCRGGRLSLRPQNSSPSYSVQVPGRQVVAEARGCTVVFAMLLLPEEIEGTLSVAGMAAAWSADITVGPIRHSLSATDWPA